MTSNTTIARFPLVVTFHPQPHPTLVASQRSPLADMSLKDSSILFGQAVVQLKEQADGDPAASTSSGLAQLQVTSGLNFLTRRQSCTLISSLLEVNGYRRLDYPVEEMHWLIKGYAGSSGCMLGFR